MSNEPDFQNEPPPSGPPAVSGGFYEKRAAHYHDPSDRLGTRDSKVLALFPGRQNLRVLDYGCGSGRFLRVLRKLGHRPLGLDISQAAVEAAEASGVRAMRGDEATLQAMLSQPERFDVITALDVLEHTFDPTSLLRHLAALLSPTGILVVSVPNLGSLLGRIHLLFGLFPHRPSGLFDFGHIRWFTRDNLRDYLRPLPGLRLTACTGTPFPTVSKFGFWRLDALQHRFLSLLAWLWPGVWGYQLVFRLSQKS